MLFLLYDDFTHGNAVNLFILYGLGTWARGLNSTFTLGDCLFGAVSLYKNHYLDKYGDIGYDIGLDAFSQFSLRNGKWVENFIIFGVNSSSFEDKKVFPISWWRSITRMT